MILRHLNEKNEFELSYLYVNFNLRCNISITEGGKKKTSLEDCEFLLPKPCYTFLFAIEEAKIGFDNIKFVELVITGIYDFKMTITDPEEAKKLLLGLMYGRQTFISIDQVVKGFDFSKLQEIRDLAFKEEKDAYYAAQTGHTTLNFPKASRVAPY